MYSRAHKFSSSSYVYRWLLAYVNLSSHFRDRRLNRRLEKVLERLHEVIPCSDMPTHMEDIDLAGCFLKFIIKTDQSVSLENPKFAKAWWEVPSLSFTGSNSKEVQYDSNLKFV